MDEEKGGPAIHDEVFAIEVAAAARRELLALGDLSGPVDKSLTLEQRERRAALIGVLSRAIARIDRVSELRTQHKALNVRVKQLEEEPDVARNADIDALVTQTAKAVYEKFAEPAPKPKPEPEKRTRLTLPEYEHGGSIVVSSHPENRTGDPQSTSPAAACEPGSRLLFCLIPDRATRVRESGRRKTRKRRRTCYATPVNFARLLLSDA